MYSSHGCLFLFVSDHPLGGSGNIFETILFASKLEVKHIMDIILDSIQLCCHCYANNIQLPLLLLLISIMSTLLREQMTS